MITAQQARELAGPTPQERVNALEPLIQEAAKKHQRQLRLDDHFWVREGYSRRKDWNAAVQILRELGFEVDFRYEERQFVDRYTIVKW